MPQKTKFMNEDLLLKYVAGKVSQAENDQIGYWLQQDSKNQKKLTQLRKIYHISVWRSDSQAAIPTQQNSKPWRKFTWNIVATIAILFTCYSLMNLYFSHSTDANKYLTIVVPAGERTQVILPDSTVVWLNAKSKLTFPNQFNGRQRKVSLLGEAFFQVTQDKSHPFIVQTPLNEVKVHGTEFNVVSTNRYFEASLLRGSISVCNKTSTKELLLAPGMRVYTSVDGSLQKGPITNYDYFLWKDGIFFFEDATFQQLAEKLEQYYDVCIQLHKTFDPNFTYSGKFRVNDGIEHVLEVLKLRTSFDYEIKENGNLIVIR